MVYLAFVNLGLIVFDLTYLWLRPQYFSYLPIITRIYDPLLGIEPHPLTTRYQELVREVGVLVAQEDSEAQLAVALAELREISLEMLEEDPFERSGQSRNLRMLRTRVRRYVSEREGIPLSELSAQQAFERFWYLEGDLTDKLSFFDRELQPLLAVNYHREYDLDGEFVDRFWMIDLPFLALFTIEFAVRWILALRDRRYPRWFLFPIFNWYDLLGIIPLRQFRVFRLFRLASIYIRLHRSEHSVVGEDIVSRTVKYFANIISEEISDMVAVRILNETQEEIRDGTHARIIRSVIEPRREALAAELTERVGQIFASTEVREQAQEFLDANLDRAVETAEALQRIPLPDALLRPLVGVVGRLVFDSIVDTVAATLESDEGQKALRHMVSNAVDGLVTELTEGEMDALVREIALEALEHTKNAVSVKKWTRPPEEDDLASQI